MPGNPPSIDTEREAPVVYLRQQRDGLKNAAYGLTEEQLRLRPTASALTVGGLIKHAANIELGWTETMIGNPDHATEQTYFDSFSLTDADTLPSMLAEFDRVAAKTEAAVAGLDDLGTKVQLPEAPWMPSDPEGLLRSVDLAAHHRGVGPARRACRHHRATDRLTVNLGSCATISV